ncbi:MAG: 4-hydroxy-tetrahydrodipicolinate reductase [Bacteroidota bacterium]
MKIALLGYGKMGQAIEKEAEARGHEIMARIDRHNLEERGALASSGAEVVIEFTHPDSFMENARIVMDQGIPMISGTTGWHAQREALAELVRSKQGCLVYSSNFSIGVNLLFKLNQALARLMDPHPQYDCFIEEQHHRHKADAPSGTAVSLGKQVLDGLGRKETLATEELRSRPPRPEELSIGYVRSGEIIGYHKVSYTSDIDTLTIEHRAHNRRGFALGAVVAAEKLPGKQGLIAFSELL